ncbi:MAG: PTS sugar transporter subunit IIA [Gemmatimonadota bacterium]|nr:PTS sugar transporter subunit IIA [Gemmatimonadota bacterium]MDH3427342.1 PTS sugar transporter subunit IIA [Gemmatimonadota bacterium]
MKLSEYADPALVVTHIEQGDIGAILAQLVAPLVPAGLVVSPDKVVSSLTARESVLSTGIGAGIAVPHAICSALAGPCLIIGISQSGVEFQAIDDQPVNVFFVLLSPPDHAGHHIRMLARIARLAKHPEFVDALRTSSDPHVVVSHIERYEAEHI